jgi:hypothetical protein
MSFTEKVLVRLDRAANILSDSATILREVVDSYKTDPNEIPEYVKSSLIKLFLAHEKDLPNGYATVSIVKLFDGSDLSEREQSIIESVAVRLEYPIEIELENRTITINGWFAEDRFFSYISTVFIDEDTDDSSTIIRRMFENNQHKMQSGTTTINLSKFAQIDSNEYRFLSEAFSSATLPISFAAGWRYFTILWWDRLSKDVSVKITDIKTDMDELKIDLAKYFNENMPAGYGDVETIVTDKSLHNLLDGADYPFNLTVNDRKIAVMSWDTDRSVLYTIFANDGFLKERSATTDAEALTTLFERAGITDTDGRMKYIEVDDLVFDSIVNRLTLRTASYPIKLKIGDLDVFVSAISDDGKVISYRATKSESLKEILTRLFIEFVNCESNDLTVTVPLSSLSFISYNDRQKVEALFPSKELFPLKIIKGDLRITVLEFVQFTPSLKALVYTVEKLYPPYGETKKEIDDLNMMLFRENLRTPQPKILIDLYSEYVDNLEMFAIPVFTKITDITKGMNVDYQTDLNSSFSKIKYPLSFQTKKYSVTIFGYRNGAFSSNISHPEAEKCEIG